MDIPHTSHGSSLSLQRPTRSLCCVYQQTPHMRCRVCFIQNSLVQSLTNFQALDVIGFAQFKQKYKSQMEERALNSGPISKGEFNARSSIWLRSEEHTSELQSLTNLVCRL